VRLTDLVRMSRSSRSFSKAPMGGPHLCKEMNLCHAGPVFRLGLGAASYLGGTPPIHSEGFRWPTAPGLV
jgi:hypothetical protein